MKKIIATIVLIALLFSLTAFTLKVTLFAAKTVTVKGSTSSTTNIVLNNLHKKTDFFFIFKTPQIFFRIVNLNES